MKIRKLKWYEWNNRLCADAIPTDFSYIIHYLSDFNKYYCCTDSYEIEFEGKAKTEEEAKALCQKQYENYIKSSIEEEK